jgi:hypothetical protein
MSRRGSGACCQSGDSSLVCPGIRFVMIWVSLPEFSIKNLLHPVIHHAPRAAMRSA